MKALTLFWTGIFTTIVFYANAQQSGDPKATEVWEPVPKMVTTGANTQPPSDAIVLFNGKDHAVLIYFPFSWSAVHVAPLSKVFSIK